MRKYAPIATAFISLIFITQTASAGLLWKDQERFDQRKKDRQETLVKNDLLKKDIKDKASNNETPKTATLPGMVSDESAEQIMKDVAQKKRAKKMISAMKSLSPTQFYQVFKMKKPDFSEKQNKDI